ncbi:MAG: CARDB domain-containing protein, partial [Candidatus Methylumidiphilus sp.]
KPGWQVGSPKCPDNRDCGAEGDDYAIVGNLAAGASKTLSFTLPSGSAGAKTLRTFIDSWCGAAELNESNNQSAQVYTVK